MLKWQTVCFISFIAIANDTLSEGSFLLQIPYLPLLLPLLFYLWKKMESHCSCFHRLLIQDQKS